MPELKSNNLAIKSLEVDGKKLSLRAVVSKQVLDRDNEVVDLTDVRFKNVDGKLAIPILLDHARHETVRATVGGVKSAEVIDDELIFDMEFSNKKQDAIDAFYLIADDLLVNPFSIGFTYSDFDGVFYKGVEIIEVSVTALPSNPKARVLEVMSKSDNTELKEAVISAYKCIGEEEDVSETKEDGSNEGDQVEETQEEASKSAGEETGEESQESNESADVEVKEEVIKEENKMTEEEIQNRIDEAVATASKEAVTKAMELSDAKEQERAAKEAEKKEEEARIEVIKDSKEVITIQSLRAARDGNRDMLANLNESAGAAFGLTEKAVHDYTNLGQAILCEELDREITRCVDETVGTIGSYVGKFNLTQSNKYSYTKMNGELNYYFIDDCDEKPDAGELTVSKFSKEPKEAAGQIAVCDNLADDLMFDLYNTIRDEFARAENRLIGKVVFTFDGGGDPLQATGILATPGVPTLTATALDRKQVLRSAVMSLCAGARAGAVWAMSQQTWYDCVLPLLDCADSCNSELSQNGNFGNFIQTLWSRPIIVDNSIPNGTIILGDFANFYKYITKGVRAIDFSSVATSDVLQVNAWDRDMTLVRSHLRATGVVKLEDAFVVITCA